MNDDGNNDTLVSDIDDEILLRCIKMLDEAPVPQEDRMIWPSLTREDLNALRKYVNARHRDRQVRDATSGLQRETAT